MDWLNYHHLYYFWVVARTGGMHAAAKELHLSPATLSVQIRELEKSAGTSLLRREGRSVVLTDTGRAVQEYADEIFNTGRELMELLRGHPSGTLPLVRIGIKDVVPKLAAYKFLQPALELDPPVRITCREGDIELLVAELSIHRLDLILSDTPIAPSMRFRGYSHLLGDSNVVWMGAASLIKKLQSSKTLDWSSVPLLLPMTNTVLRRSIELWFEKKKCKPFIRGEFDDSAMMKIVAQSAVGIVPVLELIADYVTETYGLKILAPVDGIVERFYALTVQRKSQHPAVAAIIAPKK